VDGKKIQVTAEKDPAKLPHAANQVDFVIESTGVFASREGCQKHVDAGAPKVCLTVPAKDEIDAMVVMGVNEQILKPEHKIISNASCTTNCLAPVAKVLHDAFGIEHGLMTTVHAYTNDQNILDLPHKDLRRARAAAQNIIPTTTGAAARRGQDPARAQGQARWRLPARAGAGRLGDRPRRHAGTQRDDRGGQRGLQGCVLEEAAGRHRRVHEDPVVSSDIIRNPCSALFDALSTMVMQGNMVKVIAWYDNEWGYSNRVVDLIPVRARALEPRREGHREVQVEPVPEPAMDIFRRPPPPGCVAPPRRSALDTRSSSRLAMRRMPVESAHARFRDRF
jgi:glyceraldehyde 3-phosphate dehydrogenase